LRRTAATEQKRDGKSETQELVDRPIGITEGGPQIAARHIAQIAEVLSYERFVQVVACLDVRAHLVRQGPVLIEGASGREAHDEEGRRHDDEEDRDEACDAQGDVTEHDALTASR
jgi:hypothetical protein